MSVARPPYPDIMKVCRSRRAIPDNNLYFGVDWQRISIVNPPGARKQYFQDP
jgi:hypothetical protein